eukprot:gene2737-4146_t
MSSKNTDLENPIFTTEMTKTNVQLTETIEKKTPEIIQTIEDPKIKSQQLKQCTTVDSKIFEEMKTSEGISIAELNMGLKVLIFFTSSIGCMHCKGTIHDIYTLQEELLKLNCIPVIAHEEDYETYDKFINSCDTTKKFSEILHMERKSYVKHFKLQHFSKIGETVAFLKRGFLEASRLAKLGLKNEMKYFTKDTETILSGVFVVHQQQIISEYRKEHKYQRFDLARILIDTDGTGIEVHTSIYECQIPKKKKMKFGEEPEKKRQKSQSLFKRTFSMRQDSETVKRKPTDLLKLNLDKTQKGQSSKSPLHLISPRFLSRQSSLIMPLSSHQKPMNENGTVELEDVLVDKNYLKYFKLFATKEFSVENIVFYEEVIEFRGIEDKKKRLERINEMMETFFTSDSIYEINTSRKIISGLKEGMDNENVSSDFFDRVLCDVTQTNLSDTFQRFRFSELYKEMKNEKKKKKYFLFQ